MSGCSLEAPRPGGGVKIILEETQSQATQNQGILGFEAAFFDQFNPPSVLANPSSTSDFNCFAVNVTGPGIAPQSDRLRDCTSPNQMRGTGVGILTEPATRGIPIELTVPAGPDRTIDVYGIFPSTHECGGDGNNGEGQGYFLGRVKRPLAQDVTVTVPISYGGLNPDVVCSGNSQSLHISSIFPHGGRNTGGFSLGVNGGGFLQGATVSINGTECPVTSNNGDTIQCTVPPLAVGTFTVIVDNHNGQSTTSGSAAFNTIGSGAYVSASTNPNNTPFGNVIVGQTKDITVLFMNSGFSSPLASLPSSPSLSAPFSMQSTTCSFPGTLGQDASCTAVIRFSPASIGSASSGAVSFFSSPTLSINFSGTGI